LIAQSSSLVASPSKHLGGTNEEGDFADSSGMSWYKKFSSSSLLMYDVTKSKIPR
jgi:hypothetical protein